jgi:multicomponent Na+:H+ antiporter subunit E
MDRKVVHALYLGGVLFAVWLLLSGYFTPLLIAFGIASCALVVAITARMDVVDREGHPLHLTWRALPYWTWLVVEIVKANIDVAKRILLPSHGISPTMLRVKTSQTSDLGKVIYANSITLTPGTISVDVANDEILVHALSKDGADDLQTGEMDRRVTRMAGEDR